MTNQTTFAFFNPYTGNIIGYLTIPDFTSEKQRERKLNHERIRLAVKNSIYVEDIFWQKIERKQAKHAFINEV